MDEILAKRFANGDKIAFKKIYDAHSQSALRLARVITRSDSSAADAVQEAFLRAYIHRGKYDPRRPFEMWFNRILANECRRVMKKDKKQAMLRGMVQETAEPSYSPQRAFESYESLYAALEELPEEQRTALVLKYCRGYSEDEISSILSLPKSTVKSRLFHARRKMRDRMEPNPKRGVL